uniref:Rheb small monomeric gtpase n=1 Tax=Colletotrichum fructicola (strain Nara gc5) TaxID=1213859 RepID=L2FMR7_COLFN
MATQDGPSVPRKKTTTYGKTSRKRPIHAFLELSNSSQRASSDGKDTPTQRIPTDPNRDPYDMSDDEPTHLPPSLSRRAAAQLDQLTNITPDAPANFKKRKVPTAVTTKADRRPGSQPVPHAAQSTLPSHPRRIKSPFDPRSATSLPLAKHESKPSSSKPAPKARSIPMPGPTPNLEPEKSVRHQQGEASLLDAQAAVESNIRQKSEGSSQIRHKTPARSPLIEPRFIRAASMAVESSIPKQKRLNVARRVRLIDQLAAQNDEDSSDYESDASDMTEGGIAEIAKSQSSLSTPMRPTDAAMTPRPSTRPKPLSSQRKFRSTYGEQRTLKADESGGDGLGSQMSLGIDSQLDVSPPPMSKLASFSFEDEEMEEVPSSKGGGIIDIHALRQAGANHRFADSMADLLDRVGTPQPPKSQSSRSRRTALLELATKLRDKTFVRQFRDQGAKDALFRAIGTEEDVISGFILLSVLLVLFTSYSVPHLVPQLQSEGIAQLASTMFDEDEDIISLASQRKSNLSKNGQGSLAMLRLTLERLEVWKGSPPRNLSPRILALKVLSLLCKDNDGLATRAILASLTDRLFGFVKKGWEHSRAQGMGTTEGGIALSLLEGCSIMAMQSEAGPQWTKRYLPILADILTAAMSRPMAEFGEFESTTLKLALNTTNNNPTAAGAFSRGELFRELAATSLAAFELLEQSIRNGAFSKDIYEILMLMLGVMINTSEHCPSTRQSVDAWQGDDGSPLEKLMEVYLDNRESAVMADSVEKTSVAVAHGYLAILLGYLCLGSQVRRRLEEKSQRRGIKYLLDSIQEFMALHAKVDTDELTTSLQNLVNELRQKGRDEYSILNSKHFIGIHGYMLVYSVSSLPSFEMVQVIREKILNHLGTESVPIVIVGNKSDLRPEQRQVSAEEGKKLSERIQCGWTEASARYNENVSKAFEILIAQIEKAQNPNEAAEGGKCTLM